MTIEEKLAKLQYSFSKNRKEIFSASYNETTVRVDYIDPFLNC